MMTRVVNSRSCPAVSDWAPFHINCGPPLEPSPVPAVSPNVSMALRGSAHPERRTSVLTKARVAKDSSVTTSVAMLRAWGSVAHPLARKTTGGDNCDCTDTGGPHYSARNLSDGRARTAWRAKRERPRVTLDEGSEAAQRFAQSSRTQERAVEVVINSATLTVEATTLPGDPAHYHTAISHVVLGAGL